MIALSSEVESTSPTRAIFILPDTAVPWSFSQEQTGLCHLYNPRPMSGYTQGKVALSVHPKVTAYQRHLHSSSPFFGHTILALVFHGQFFQKQSSSINHLHTPRSGSRSPSNALTFLVKDQSCPSLPDSTISMRYILTLV